MRTTMDRPQQRRLLWLTVVGALQCSTATNNCPQIIFPTMSSSLNVTVAENTEVSLPFSLDTSKCKVSGDHYTIYVSSRPRDEDDCIIKFVNGKCTSILQDVCRCRDDNEGGGVLFTKIMTRKDSGAWMWKTSDHSSEKEIYFHINSQSPGKSQTTSPSSTTLKFKERSPTEMRTPNVNDRKGVTAKHDVTKTNAVQKEIQDSGSKTNDGVVDKDDGDEAQSDSNMGPVFVGVNVGAFILVAIIVFVVLRRRQKNKRNQPVSQPPKVPCDGEYDVMFVGRRPEPMVGDVRNSYELPGIPTPRHYDRLSSARSETMNSDYIEVRESGYGYELVV
ncbi:uncharacterized protein [Littorina saxatilis]|uniref:uncharacterized protein n=1 Tax=Littorina saxatilis TaxID=31220 RepID=UPI0038B45E4A